MFPRIAQRLAESNIIAHRYNFSHSGMTNTLDTFEKPELFTQDTWKKQVYDIHRVIDAVADGTLAGKDSPLFLIGHSRGGISTILASAQRFDDNLVPKPAGIVTMASPDETCRMENAQIDAVLTAGYVTVTSSRTGQDLRIDANWLKEQLDDPDGHNVCAAMSRIKCPALIIHGSADPTIDPICAQNLTQANTQAQLMMINDGNHVFNVTNPLADDAPESTQLKAVIQAIQNFVRDH